MPEEDINADLLSLVKIRAYVLLLSASCVVSLSNIAFRMSYIIVPPPPPLILLASMLFTKGEFIEMISWRLFVFIFYTVHLSSLYLSMFQVYAS